MAFPSEPSPQLEDTQPRQPTQALIPDPSWSVPLDTGPLIVDDEITTPSRLPCLLSGIIIFVSILMCGVIVLLSAVAGYRDELKAIQTKETRGIQATSAIQYQLALENINNGQYEFAYERLSWIATRQPSYMDVQQQLAQIEIVLSYTPTLAITNTPIYTPTSTLTPTPEVSPTPTTSEVELYFNQAKSFYSFNRWEDTIAALEVVISLDPTYRRNEVDQMLFDAYNKQARIYFNGTNPLNEDGPNGFAGNQLSRGLVLYNLAYQMVEEGKPVGTFNDLPSFEAFIVEGFLAAKRYLDAGQPQLALPILEEIYALSPAWGYRGLTIEQLLIQARGS